MRWRCIIFRLSLLVVLALLLASPAAARGNATPGIYPGTIKDVCVGDTIFVGETGLNLTPLTPYASGKVVSLWPDPSLTHGKAISVSDSRSFDVESTKVKDYGIYYPVSATGHVLWSYAIRIQPFKEKYPYNVVVTSSKGWIMANGAESSTITVSVTDGGNNPISGAAITLSVSSPWAVSDSVLVTDGSGKAQTSFLATTRSGTAVITASASVAGVTTTPVTTTGLQKIDAATPAKATSIYPIYATVGSPVNISVFVADRYGNPVTSLQSEKTVLFYSLSAGSGAFLDEEGSRVKSLNVSLNSTGYAEATFYLNTLRGDNLVLILPPTPVSFQILDVEGIGNSKPASIIQVTDPSGNPPFIPADGESKATIDYFLFDEWGNPSIDQAINITTDVGERRIFITNQEGRVSVTYGPKLKAAFYTLTATAVENPAVQVVQALQFGSLDPDEMLLTASPQTMASLDANSQMRASVIGKVIDIKGNPVKGQTVTFMIEKDSSPTLLNRSAAIRDPGKNTTHGAGEAVSIITDGNGQAILDFIPGSFPIWPEVGYSDKATGTTTLSATWKNPNGTAVVRTIDLQYKNYPFLSVYTEVSPKTVQIGNLVNVSVRLKGDGWALQPKPIDVVLCTDRSGTMLINESVSPYPKGILIRDSYNDRMIDAMNAAKAFIGKTTSQDRLGIITFGTPKNNLALLFNTGTPSAVDSYGTRAGRDYDCKVYKSCADPNNLDISNKTPFILSAYRGHGATGRDYTANGVMTGTYVEAPLGSTTEVLSTAIDNIVPAGGTPTRRGIYESVKMLLANPRPMAVKAIVLLTDGKFNVGGDPRGIAVDPMNPTDSYPELANDPIIKDGTGSVITWAKNNGVKIFTIGLKGSDTRDLPNEAELKAYADETGGKYHPADDSTKLAGIYMEIAGELREEASVNTQLTLDFRQMEVNGVPNIPGNTVFTYRYIPLVSTLIIPPSKVPLPTVNNEANWKTGIFNFSQGTIKVNEEWMVNFTLNSTMEGNIKVLSAKSSRVTFEGVEGNVSIPDTYITSIPRGTEKGPEDIVFAIKNLETGDQKQTQVVQLTWTYFYNGGDGNIGWQVWLAPLNSNAYQFKGDFSRESVREKDTPLSYNLVVKDLKPGSYMVKVIGHVRDANDAVATRALTIPGETQKTWILIQ